MKMKVSKSEWKLETKDIYTIHEKGLQGFSGLITLEPRLLLTIQLVPNPACTTSSNQAVFVVGLACTKTAAEH